MVYCTITLLLYGIVVLYHYYNTTSEGKRSLTGMGIGSRRKKAGALAVSRILL